MRLLHAARVVWAGQGPRLCSVGASKGLQVGVFLTRLDTKGIGCRSHPVQQPDDLCLQREDESMG